MTTTHPETGTPGALGAYLIALLVVAGAAASVLVMGLGGLILWFVALTFLILAGMIIVSFP
ncbi:hypothetical protein DFO80_11724 [Rhodobacter sp. 140A]|uniref:Uncharacterized protein n=2 Tax=root TaxID=1 RepID=A0A443LZP8_9RHOB|nr:hypothetical protein [Sinirhodobacter huangdaonensis]RBP86781.1 hypothetical protein DFO80_11724 [Rhodobacter sp. 140A]RWR54740.1 hypothetical protein EOW66_01355 [Sinirhodobacter huangdaonensis]